jgi:hypothetical protein
MKKLLAVVVLSFSAMGAGFYVSPGVHKDEVEKMIDKAIEEKVLVLIDKKLKEKETKTRLSIDPGFYIETNKELNEPKE